jgi:hypothetical protein
MTEEKTYILLNTGQIYHTDSQISLTQHTTHHIPPPTGWGNSADAFLGGGGEWKNLTRDKTMEKDIRKR